MRSTTSTSGRLDTTSIDYLGMSRMQKSMESIEAVPLGGRHGDTQTNKPLNRDDRGFSKLLSRGV